MILGFALSNWSISAPAVTPRYLFPQRCPAHSDPCTTSCENTKSQEIASLKLTCCTWKNGIPKGKSSSIPSINFQLCYFQGGYGYMECSQSPGKFLWPFPTSPAVGKHPVLLWWPQSGPTWLWESVMRGWRMNAYEVYGDRKVWIHWCIVMSQFVRITSSKKPKDKAFFFPHLAPTVSTLRERGNTLCLHWEISLMWCFLG